jgi:hypothetical protein
MSEMLEKIRGDSMSDMMIQQTRGSREERFD